LLTRITAQKVPNDNYSFQAFFVRETHVVLLELPSLEEALSQFHSVELASKLVALLPRSDRL